MDYTMEDTQNSAPGEFTMHEVAKLGSAPQRRIDAQSVTKRYVLCLSSTLPFYPSSRPLHDTPITSSLTFPPVASNQN